MGDRLQPIFAKYHEDHEDCDTDNAEIIVRRNIYIGYPIFRLQCITKFFNAFQLIQYFVHIKMQKETTLSNNCV